MQSQYRLTNNSNINTTSVTTPRHLQQTQYHDYDTDEYTNPNNHNKIRHIDSVTSSPLHMTNNINNNNNNKTNQNQV